MLQCVSIEVACKNNLAIYRHVDGKGKNILAFQILVVILLSYYAKTFCYTCKE